MSKSAQDSIQAGKTYNIRTDANRHMIVKVDGVASGWVNYTNTETQIEHTSKIEQFLKACVCTVG